MQTIHLSNLVFGVAKAVAQATTVAYVDLADSIIDSGPFRYVSYTLACLTQNSLYKIIGSNDGDNWFDVVAEQAISAAAIDSQAITAPTFRYYKVQIKESVAGGTISAVGHAK